MAWIGVITNEGNQMLRAWTDGVLFNLDFAAAGTGTVKEAALLTQTALADQRQLAGLVSYQTVNSGRKVKLQIGPADETYLLQQIGLWGSLDGGEPHLAALFQNTEGVRIPSKTENVNFAYTFLAGLEVSNTKDFSITTDDSVFVTMDTFKKMIPLGGIGMPDGSTIGTVGQHYVDVEARIEYVCMGLVYGQYLWLPVGGDADWADITSKPTTFPPSAHSHAWADVTGKPTTFSPSAHSHAWADVTGKPSTFAPSAHNHAASEITSGTLSVARGGTGNTTGNAATATKLATARTIRTNLASTAAATFDGSANAAPGVTGTLGVGNGGTGVTTLAALASALQSSGGMCKIATGSYVGNGLYGASNPCSLTFNFSPMVVMIVSYLDSTGSTESELMYLLQGHNLSRSLCQGNVSPVNVSWSGNSVSYYGVSARLQFNYNSVYRYIVLG